MQQPQQIQTQMQQPQPPQPQQQARQLPPAPTNFPTSHQDFTTQQPPAAGRPALFAPTHAEHTQGGQALSVATTALEVPASGEDVSSPDGIFGDSNM
jgi:hypothetical protein